MGIEGQLKHRCTIRSVTKTQNNAGEEVDGVTTDQTDIPCLFGEVKRGRVLSASGEWVKRNPVVILPGWVTITEKSLIIGTVAPGNEATFRVENIQSPAPSTEILHHIVEIKRVD